MKILLGNLGTNKNDYKNLKVENEMSMWKRMIKQI